MKFGPAEMAQTMDAGKGIDCSHNGLQRLALKSFLARSSHFIRHRRGRSIVPIWNADRPAERACPNDRSCPD